MIGIRGLCAPVDRLLAVSVAALFLLAPAESRAADPELALEPSNASPEVSRSALADSGVTLHDRSASVIEAFSLPCPEDADCPSVIAGIDPAEDAGEGVARTVPAGSREVRFQNNCHHTIYLAITYRDASGDWMSASWWRFEPGKGGPLTTSTGPLVTSDEAIRFHARTSVDTPALFIWDGDVTSTFGGTQYGTRPLQLYLNEEGNYFMSIGCAGVIEGDHAGRAGLDWLASPVIAGNWTTLEANERSDAARALRLALRHENLPEPMIRQIRRVRLQGFGEEVLLHEAEVRLPDGTFAIHTFARHGDSTYLLRGTPGWTTTLNARAGLRLDNEDRALEFLRLVGTGDVGNRRAMQFLDQATDLPWQEGASILIGMRVVNLVQPPTITREASGWAVQATVRYGNDLVGMTLALSDAGALEVRAAQALERDLPLRAVYYENGARVHEE